MMRRAMLLVLLFLMVLIVPHLWMASRVYSFDHWSRSNWGSAALAPDPATTREAVIQVYAARTWGWKGVFAVHSWIAIKNPGARQYERYEVVGWGVSRGAPAVRKNRHVADGHWAGNPPDLLVDLRGARAEALIEKVMAAIESYPYPHIYRTWPGPNSNTFIAHIGRSVPELGLHLPPTAVGKDYLGARRLLAKTPSGSGYQLSFMGVAGLSLGRAEGLEFNILGLTFGVSPLNLSIKLPGIGEIKPA